MRQAQRNRKSEVEIVVTIPGPSASRPDGQRPPTSLRCFISARFEADVWPLRKVLEDRGIEPILAYEQAPIGLSVADTVTALIDDADLVVAVLDDPESAANVAFELGYAFALRKKLLVLLSRRYRSVPANLRTSFYIRAEPDATDAIGLAIDQVLAASPPKRAERSIPLDPTPPLGDLADKLLAEIERRPQLDVLEQTMVEATQASGASVFVGRNRVTSSHEQESKADAAIWSDQLVVLSGAPPLVKFVEMVPTLEEGHRIQREMEARLDSTTSSLALVLYLDGISGDEARSLSGPRVLFMRADTFYERWRDQNLDDVVRTFRNQVVHGR